MVMNVLTRGMRNAIRHAIRPVAVIVILGLSIGLGLVTVPPLRAKLAVAKPAATRTGPAGVSRTRPHGVPQPAQPPGIAAPTGPQWLVKSNDLALLGQQAADEGLVMPRFTWVGCGGLSDPDACLPGQQPIYTNYQSLRAAAEAGMAGTAVFDIEPWRRTPADERANPGFYICKAARLQQTDPRLKVIITPYVKPPGAMLHEDVTAASCHAYAVDIQSQFANANPEAFNAFIQRDVGDIRAVNKKVLILAGLATNSPGVQTPQDLVSDYHAALADGVQGFWLNAADWGHENHCTAAEGGPGCPEVGVKFLEDIGLIAVQPA
jgi:hypothetical protein